MGTRSTSRRHRKPPGVVLLDPTTDPAFIDNALRTRCRGC